MRLGALLTLAAVFAACGRTEPLRDRQRDSEVIGARPVEPIDLIPRSDAGCSATAVEEYTIPPMDRRPIDVLFVIDDSCSMENDQRQLASNFDSFFSTFKANQVDFHLGVVTTDMFASNRSGRLVAPFLTPQTPNVDTVFKRMVLVGTQGSGLEMGLGAARAALREPLISTTNAGLVRAEADFALVFLTDEDDSSTVNISGLADAVKSMKTEGSSITVASILLSCFGSDRWRYAQFTRLFGDRGIITRCDSTYSTTLRTIAGRVVNKRCVFGLREKLDEKRKIRVTMNGQPTTWHAAPPEDAFPQGSIEVEPCPEGGGKVELIYDLCE